MAPALLSPLLLLAAAAGARAAAGGSDRYDAVVLGSGIKESLVSAALASQGKRVLQLDASTSPGGESASLDLRSLYAELVGAGAEPEGRLGAPNEYHVDLTPKALLASGEELQLFVNSGLWQHMDFRRVHRSFIYRLRPDGQPDVHRVISNAEDVLKTRMLPPLDKAKVLDLFNWINQFNEDDPSTYNAGRINKRRLALHKMSSLAFFKFWDISPQSAELLAQGLGRFSGGYKALRRLPALQLVRDMKAYKDAYKTFPHMTSPYVFPVGGVGASLHKAAAKVLEAHVGESLLGQTGAKVLFDETGRACGVSTKAGEVRAECVIASAARVPERARQSHQVVRLYAVLTHPPNKCKDARSCQLLMPAVHCDRKHDVFLFSTGPIHGIAPSGKWVAVASTRVEGPTEGLSAMAVAKRELAAVLPLLKPTRKMLAKVSTVCEPLEEAEGAAGDSGLHLLSSCDETSLFPAVAADVTEVLARVLGE